MEPANAEAGPELYACNYAWSHHLFGEIPGGGTYEELAAGAIDLQLFETKCLCLSLRQLIRAKRAAGRPKDLQVLAELESIEDERG